MSEKDMMRYGNPEFVVEDDTADVPDWVYNLPDEEFAAYFRNRAASGNAGEPQT